jgi:DNA polymerase IV
VQQRKAIVTPQWLHDSIAHGSSLPCEEYTAIHELRATTAENCPECGCSGHQSDEDSDGSGSDNEIQVALGRRRKKRKVEVCHSCHCTCEGHAAEAHDTTLLTPPSSPDIVVLSRPPTPPPALPTPQTTPRRQLKAAAPAPNRSSSSTLQTPAYLLPHSPPPTTDLSKLRPDAQLACQRAFPLVCPNQGLVEALDVIRRSRSLEGEARSELSYMRAIGVIKGLPFSHFWKYIS